MFGYIKIDKQELKGKDIHKYSTYYCGLCETIKKKFGYFDRIFLSYDVTYLLVVMDSLSSNDRDIVDKRVGCLRKFNLSCSNGLLMYASFINMYLLVKKMEDNYIDDMNILAKGLSNKLSRNKNYRKAYEIYSELVEGTNNNLAKLVQMELCKKKIKVDDLCVPFAEIMGDILAYPFRHRKNYKNIYEFGYYLGRIVYLMDALDDYKEDKRKGKFNPFFNFALTDERDVFEFAISSINLTYMKLKEALSRLEIKKNRDIVENVINYGIPKCVFSIVNSKYRELCGRCDK